MKTIFTILILSISSISFSQDFLNYDPVESKPDINLHLSKPYSKKRAEGEMRLGPVMMIGGAVLGVAGLLTTNTQNADLSDKPFMEQGAKTLAVISGAVVFTAGLVITIGGN